MQPPPEVECRSKETMGCLPSGGQPVVTKYETCSAGYHSGSIQECCYHDLTIQECCNQDLTIQVSVSRLCELNAEHSFLCEKNKRIILLALPLRPSVRGCCRVMEIFEPQN